MPKKTLETIVTLRAENAELKKENEYLKSLLDDRCDRCISRERAEARKEFVDTLKKIYPVHEGLHRIIDDLLEEMEKET